MSPVFDHAQCLFVYNLLYMAHLSAVHSIMMSMLIVEISIKKVGMKEQKIETHYAYDKC